MSNLLFCDSFEHYSTAQGSRKYTLFNGSLGITSSGRTGKGLSLGISGLGSNAQITFAQGVQSIVTAGFALQYGGIVPVVFGNAATGLTFSVGAVGDGRVTVTAGTGPHSTTSSPSTFVFNGGIWYYVELQASVSGSVVSGNSRATVTYNLKVNGSTILSGTMTVDWNGTVDPTQISWSYSSLQGSIGCIVDDYYITDNEFLGDVSIACLYPNAEGDLLQFTCSSGSTHNTLVSETPADDDTSYVYDDGTTLNHIDLYNLQDLTGTPGIKGTQVVLTVKNDIAGSSTLQAMQKSGGTTTAGTSLNLTTNTYINILDPRRKNPATSTDYLASEINAIQIGVKRTA